MGVRGFVSFGSVIFLRIGVRVLIIEINSFDFRPPGEGSVEGEFMCKDKDSAYLNSALEEEDWRRLA